MFSVRTGCTEEGPTLHLCNPPDTGPPIIIPGPVPHSLMSGRKSGREKEREIEKRRVRVRERERKREESEGGKDKEIGTERDREWK